jgi:serine/threonine protein kinase
MANPRGSVVIAGKYRLGRALARGGMGAVWVGHHLQLDVPVAIKFMDAGMSAAPDARARFEREARSAALIRSPHVVQILDHGVDSGMHYIVMELLEGENLGDRLRRDCRLTIPDAANIVLQVAKALRRAHEAGIVHRDLKPTNIFLAQVDDEEIVKVLDFGIAKAALCEGNNNVTKTGVVMGSPSYMSPEQARDIKSVDHRADLWSLAVVLFRALTGEMIFHAESSVDLILKLCNEKVPLASSVAPDLPRDFDIFFERAFCRDLNGRFQSAREMALALTEVVRRLGFSKDLSQLASPSLSLSVRPGEATPPLQRRSTPPAPFPQVNGPPPPADSNPGASLRSTNMPPPGEPRLLQLLKARPDSWHPDPLPEASHGLESAARCEPTLREGGRRNAGREDAPEHTGARRSATITRIDRPGQERKRSTLPKVSNLIDEGFSALRAGDRDTARRCWSEALDLDPSNRMIELNLRRLIAISG